MQLSFLSFGSFVTHAPRWAVLYTLGNIVSLASTFFLIGPMRQVRQMSKPTRYIAAIIYVLSLAGTLCAAFIPKEPNALLWCVCACFVARAVRRIAHAAHRNAPAQHNVRHHPVLCARVVLALVHSLCEAHGQERR